MPYTENVIDNVLVETRIGRIDRCSQTLDKICKWGSLRNIIKHKRKGLFDNLEV
jgi:hypothetical protein